MSPYLYLLCAVGLSTLVHDAEKKGLIHGCKVARGALIVYILLFANDCFFFVRADIEEYIVLKSILAIYELNASRPAINFTKSGVFF